MLIKVISLPRSTDRRDNFKRNNPNLDYEFFDAVDGRSLTESEIQQSKIFDPTLTYSPGAYGCAMSHMKLWGECVANGESIVIAEDDAIFRNDFSAIHDDIVNSLPKNWDFVLWGWNFDFWLQMDLMPEIASTAIRFDQEELRKNIKNFQLSRKPSSAFRLKKVWGIPAYTISPTGASKFLELCTPLRPLEIPFNFTTDRLGNTGIDSQMNLIYPETLSYVAFPPVVATPNLHSASTIQTEKTSMKKSWLSKQAKKIRTLYKPQT